MLSRRPRQSHCFAAVQRGWKRQHHKKHIASLSSSVVLHSQGYTYAYATLQACWRRLSNSTGARPKVCAGRSAISKSLERAMWSSQRPAPLHPFEWAKRFNLWKQASHRSSRHFPSRCYRGFARCVGFEVRSSMKIYDCLSDAGVSSTQAAAPLNKDKCLHGENATPKWQHYRLSNSVYRLVFSSAQNPMLSSTTEQSIDNTTEVLWAGITLSWIDDSMESRVMNVGSGKSCRPLHVVQACRALVRDDLVRSSGTVVPFGLPAPPWQSAPSPCA